MSNPTSIPSITIDYGATGTSMQSNEFGMRPMQERAYEKRGEQYLLIKSPPASGKSRALMFVALDKLHNQGVRQAIIVVPEKSIGASFASESLTENGFYWDWGVRPQWNLCNAPGTDGGKVASVAKFLASEDRVLVCTHATFRFALDKIGIEAFDNRLIAIDEFHHVSTNDNKLGAHLSNLMARDKTHIVAMTGSYFRGDAEAVLIPDDEAKFETVTYTYYEQLNGYRYLKHLDIGYYFYSGEYSDEILGVIEPTEKTIIHIPSVNSRESTKDKIKEVNHIINELGEWLGVDDETGFHLVKTDSGVTLRIADLVDPQTQSRTQESLRSLRMKTERNYVDIIIALGMAKEGFDWIWCEHALTVGYRSSLTEIIQIIGRATRDAEGKVRARFTNLIAEPDADQGSVVDAVNDTIKAIAASLLMEQVLAPKFNFRAKNPNNNEPIEGYDYGDMGYDPSGTNIGYDQHQGQFDIQINGLREPLSKEANRICQEDLNEIIASFIQDKTTMERGMFDEALIPEEITQVRMGKIVRDKYPSLEEEDLEAVRQHAIAAMNIAQQAKKLLNSDNAESRNTALIDGVRKFAMDVRELDIDLIDRINPFSEAYAVISKAMNEKSLREIASIITGKKINLTAEEARELARRALKFKNEHGRLPSETSTDPWEARMAEGVNFLARLKAESMNE